MSVRHLVSPLLFVCCIVATHLCYAQKEIGESVEMTQKGINAKTDSFYFEAIKARMTNDDQLAYRLFEQFAALRPEVSDTWYELSKLCYSDKKTDKAEEYVKKAIVLNPDNKWYKEEYASILAETGEYAQAAKVVGELSVSEPDDPSYLLTAAEYYEKAKQYDQSLIYLDKALAERGPDEDVFLLKEQVYLGMNNVEKAAGVVRQLIQMQPKNGKYYKLLGDLYDNNKLPAKAAEVYEQAEKIIPTDPYVQSGRAEHFLSLGDTASYATYIGKAILNKELDVESQMELLSDLVHSLPNDSVVKIKALPIMSQLVKQHPDDPQILVFFGDFQQMNNRPDSAIWAYNRSLQIKSSIDIWRKLLGTFLQRQQGDSLIKNSEKFIRLYPNQVDPQFYNAEGHLLKKEYGKAIKAINRAIDNQPDNDRPALANLYAVLGEIYHESKQADLSDKAFEKAIDLDPGNASTLNNYAYFLSERGARLDEAEKMSKKSLDLEPGAATYLDTYGWILYKKGDYEKAKVFVKRAIDLSGANADGTLFDHLGDIYFKLNARDKAIENWKLAKQKGTDNVQIDKKISEGKLYE